MRIWVLLAGALLLLEVQGCVHVSPRIVTEDRADYGQSIADSWKEQTLSNIVRLRYGDAPMFLEVTSVITSYSTSGSVSLSGSATDVSPGSDAYGIGAGGSRYWSNSPTVTYQPLAGQRFTASLLRPIPAASIFQMIQAGWPITFIFRTALNSINGLQNQSRGLQAMPEFDRLVTALERLKNSRSIDIRVDDQGPGNKITIVLPQLPLPDSVVQDLQTVRDLLGLKPGLLEYSVALGSIPSTGNEIAVLTRSMIEILLECAHGVDVPDADVLDGRVATGRVNLGETRAAPVIQIHSGKEAPGDSFVAVPYRGKWFWVDDRDIASKAKFTFLMILFSLAESGTISPAPLITVGAGN